MDWKGKQGFTKGMQRLLTSVGGIVAVFLAASILPMESQSSNRVYGADWLPTNDGSETEQHDPVTLDYISTLVTNHNPHEAAFVQTGYHGVSEETWTTSAGVEATFLVPRGELFESALTFQTQSLANVASNNAGPGGLTAAPRVWVMFQHAHGSAFRVSYWAIGSEASRDTSFTNGGQLASFSGSTAFQSSTLDVEYIRQIHSGPWSLMGGIGGRYAAVQSCQTLVGIVPDETTSSLMSQQSNLDAGGLTFVLEAKRQMRKSGFHVFSHFRSSVLWGESTGLGHLNIADPLAPVTVLDVSGVSLAKSSVHAFTGQVGVEWAESVRSSRFDVVFRAAFEYQSWVSSQAASADIFTLPPPVRNVRLSPEFGHDLTGFMISMGIVF